MKKVFVFLFLFVSINAFADKRVSGYYKSNGTHVNSYMRTNANSTKSDNFSTYGNINPYTGKVGTKKYYRHSK